MRGFNNSNQANTPVMGEAFYSYAVKQGNRTDDRTLIAKEWFKRPAYWFGQRRREDERPI